MSKTKLNELKELEKLQKRIARKKQRIEEQIQAEAETAKWYDQVLKESGYQRPRAFVKALMEHFGIRTLSLAKSKSKRGPGRPPKKTSSASTDTKKKAKPAAKRKRTKVTVAVRDKVKDALNDGLSKNAASKQFGISYIVIKKIADGAYDKL